MDKWDLIEQAFFDGTFDAAWNETDHPREGGKFTSQGGGGGGSKGAPKTKKHILRRTGKILGHAALGGLFGAGYGAYQGYKQPFKRDQRETEFLAKLARKKYGGEGKDAEPKKGMLRISVNPSKIGHRIADIGPGGKEHNVKTSANWPKKPKGKDAFGSRISGALRGAVSGAKAGRQATGQRIAGTMAGGVGGAMHGWRGAPIVPRLNNRSAALMSAKAQRR